MAIKQVKCDSGVIGWEARLQDNYDSFDEWQMYALCFDLHKKLGYARPEDAWNKNPIIQGSVNISDFKKISE